MNVLAISHVRRQQALTVGALSGQDTPVAVLDQVIRTFAVCRDVE